MPTPNSPQDLWQSQTEEEIEMTPGDIRRMAQKFQTKILRRNIREAIFTVLGTAMYIGFIWQMPGTLLKSGCAVSLIGICISGYRLLHEGSSQDVPAAASAGDCLEFHRRELTKQRDMLRQVGIRQMGPVMPGFVLFYAGAWIENVDGTADAVVMGGSGVLAVAVFVLVYWLNVHAANKLQSELDELGA